MKRGINGFSLIEMLVVISIIVLLMGLIGFVTTHDQRSSQVHGAADELASVLRRTRHRAIADRRMYGVAFNIQNEPGSSGAVLNNRSGGHWYRVIGPSLTTRYSATAPEIIPWARATRTDGNTNFPDFVQDVEACWTTPPYPLPARKVRFLALGDVDEGPRQRSGSGGFTNIWYSDGGETTYPRPWFGYYDSSTQTLWPWGGYTPGKTYSGFYYQGSDPVVVGCRNPVSRIVSHDWNGDNAWTDVDRNLDGDLDDPGERETAFPLQLKDEPRPLVNAAWLDAIVLFYPDGRAEFMEWNRARRSYLATPDPSPALWDNNFGSGVPDRAKPGSGPAIPFTDSIYGISNIELGEVAHFQIHTGNWYITLAPDVLDDRTTFPSAKAAIASMSPCWRVGISPLGIISVIPVMERDGYAAALRAQNKVWPPSPADWLDANPIASNNKIWDNCRLGILHVTIPGWWNSPGKPRGMPITNILDPLMLTDRIWWKLP